MEEGAADLTLPQTHQRHILYKIKSLPRQHDSPPLQKKADVTKTNISYTKIVCIVYFSLCSVLDGFSH